MCGCEKCHPGRIFNLYLFFKDLLIFGCPGFLLMCVGLLQLQCVGATL